MTFNFRHLLATVFFFTKSQVQCYWCILCWRIIVKIWDAPIDWPVIWIGRFFAWPARIGDRLVFFMSSRFQALLLPAAQAETSQCTLTVTCKHVICRENDSNLNCIQCKWRLIMYLCRARCGLHSLSECVRERQHTQSNSQKCIDTYCGRKINKRFTKYDLGKQH